jgi:hypothetical protein
MAKCDLKVWDDASGRKMLHNTTGVSRPIDKITQIFRTPQSGCQIEFEGMSAWKLDDYSYDEVVALLAYKPSVG